MYIDTHSPKINVNVFGCYFFVVLWMSLISDELAFSLITD